MQELEYKIDRASTVMAMLGNSTRLHILCKLFDEEKSVSDLAQNIGLSQSALSQHLAKLRMLNLVTTRRAAQTIYYSLAGEEIKTILNALHGLYCTPEETQS